jgi:hypothetical protein
MATDPPRRGEGAGTRHEAFVVEWGGTIVATEKQRWQLGTAAAHRCHSSAPEAELIGWVQDVVSVWRPSLSGQSPYAAR